MEHSYPVWLKKDINSVIESIDLSDLQKHFLRSRWLEEVLWMESKAHNARMWHYFLRLVAIIGGVIVPALIGLNPSDRSASDILRIFTFAISLVVAISVAVEGFLRYGERWRHYRRTVELLKVEGWQFFQLGGPYRTYGKHSEAYPFFAEKVEERIQQEVDVYIAEVVKDKEKEKREEGISDKNRIRNG